MKKIIAALLALLLTGSLVLFCVTFVGRQVLLPAMGEDGAQVSDSVIREETRLARERVTALANLYGFEAEPVTGLDKLLRSDDLYANNDMEDVRRRSPEFHETVRKLEVETLCVVRIGLNMNTYGYLICAEARNRRIWQEAECAILFFLAKMMAASIVIDGEALE